ncbi:RHS repeat-associated core domain-containing protein [Pseudomonas sp. NMI760_13]|uniref:RHS repeat-associated core domain-containing protein n=1 Tax=Pseudomonas sp. NMI760_13 TaxID=2903147 RepID=UPI001E40A3E9|nr:RHS repeat-associated core domain-containing protein [Pseudomonas sp. NMI760_13]MCE0912870.1 RHS repeat-associated core domain-containing protein [Pseudomonas sp. NMI760_13]
MGTHEKKAEQGHLSSNPHSSIVHLLATERSGSVVEIRPEDKLTITYSPYGMTRRDISASVKQRFNGHLRERCLDGYLLGNGYRMYNTLLMRFNSPDNLSPFLQGGINPYMYCSGDPVNRHDPTGHVNNRIASPQQRRALPGLVTDQPPATYDPTNANAPRTENNQELFGPTSQQKESATPTMQHKTLNANDSWADINNKLDIKDNKRIDFARTLVNNNTTTKTSTDVKNALIRYITALGISHDPTLILQEAYPGIDDRTIGYLAGTAEAIRQKIVQQPFST